MSEVRGRMRCTYENNIQHQQRQQGGGAFCGCARRAEELRMEALDPSEVRLRTCQTFNDFTFLRSETLHDTLFTLRPL